MNHAGGGGGDMLRIIAGDAKGRPIRSLPGRETRPTSGRVKESLFNIIGSDVISTAVLDLFAGTGSLGLEALSRGADRAVFIDREKRCARLIKQNLASLGFHDRGRVSAASLPQAVEHLRGKRFQLVFIDPPYGRGLAVPVLETIDKVGILAGSGLVAVEHSSREELPEQVGGLSLRDRRSYGDTALSFYSPAGREPLEPGESRFSGSR